MKNITLFAAIAVFAVFMQNAIAQQSTFPMATQGPRLIELESKPSREKIVQSIGHATRYFIEKQNPQGSWGSARKTKSLNIYAPGSSHDAYLGGTTALGLAALLEVEAALKCPDKYSQGPLTAEELQIDRDELTRVINKGENWILDKLPKLRRSSGDVLYNSWGHAYGIQALVRMLDRFPEDEQRCEKIRAAIRQQIQLLERFECLDGGWCYYDFDHQTQKTAGSPFSFVSAAVLIALWEAKSKDIEIPQRIVDRALASNRRQRYPDFSYAYGEYLKMDPLMEINRPPGSLGRSQSCNLAAKHWGDKDITNEVLQNWLNRMFSRNGWLDMGRKRPIPHESHALVAGYFYYYGVFYSALCIEELPEEKRQPYKEHLAALLVDRQGTDGSWFDYPLYDYGHAYATGYGLMSILRSL